MYLSKLGCYILATAKNTASILSWKTQVILEKSSVNIQRSSCFGGGYWLRIQSILSQLKNSSTGLWFHIWEYISLAAIPTEADTYWLCLKTSQVKITACRKSRLTGSSAPIWVPGYYFHLATDMMLPRKKKKNTQVTNLMKLKEKFSIFLLANTCYWSPHRAQNHSSL